MHLAHCLLMVVVVVAVVVVVVVAGSRDSCLLMVDLAVVVAVVVVVVEMVVVVVVEVHPSVTSGCMPTVVGTAYLHHRLLVLCGGSSWTCVATCAQLPQQNSPPPGPAVSLEAPRETSAPNRPHSRRGVA